MLLRARGVVLLTVVLSACSSSDEGVTPERCAELRDHMIDLRLRDVASGRTLPFAEPAAPVALDLTAHRAAMKRALGDRFVATCEHEMTSAQLRCLLAADTSAAAGHCPSAAPPSPAQRSASK